MRNYKLKSKPKGAILALVLMVVLLLSMSSLALIGLGTRARLRAVKNVAQMSARFAADAGVERVLYLMNQELAAGTWVTDSVPTYSAEALTASASTYTVSFTGTLTDGYTITSVGQNSDQTKTVRATIALTSPVGHDYAVFSKKKLVMKSKSTVGGFNSSDPSDTDVHVKIASESTDDDTIDLKSGTTIDGDILIAAGADADGIIKNLNDVTLNGNILYLPPSYYLPTLTAPDYIVSLGALSGNNITLTASDSGKYTNITINNNGTLTIQDDVTLHVTGDIELKNNAAIEVSGDSSLTLYFDGNFDAQNSSGINNVSQIPANVRLYGTGTDQTIDIKNSSDLYAVVYAPNADMNVYNKVDAFGSFIVDNFELKNGGEIYYDEALKQLSADDALVRFAIVRWEEL